MSANWKQRPEGGSYFASWLIRTIACRGGRVVSRVLLYPITLYFLLMRGPERRASLAYLARVLPHPPGLRHVARHLHTFASTILSSLTASAYGVFDWRTRSNGSRTSSPVPIWRSGPGARSSKPRATERNGIGGPATFVN